jgi:Fe-S cluster assembly iron-binding protein IscA
MVITLTEMALNKLKVMKLQKEQFPRIDADIAGGCGMSIRLRIIFDEARRNDILVEYEGIQIRIDHFTKRYLDKEVKIDYNNRSGFLIGDSYESSSCAIDLG